MPGAISVRKNRDSMSAISPPNSRNHLLPPWRPSGIMPPLAEPRLGRAIEMMPQAPPSIGARVRKALHGMASSEAPARSPFARAAFIGLAVLSLLLGLVGLVAPVIPGLMFLSLGGLFLARGSERWRRWLHGRPWYVRLRNRIRPDDASLLP